MVVRSNSILGGVLGVAFLLAVSGPAQAGPNLVLNGNFATGDFTDWSYSSTGGSAAVVVNPDGDTLTIGSPDLSVGNGVYFTTDTGTQTLSQTVALGVGTYSIGFDLSVPLSGYLNANDATFAASIAGTPLLSAASVHAIGAADGTDTWVNVTGVADVAVAGNYTVDFTFTGEGTPAADVVVDRVFVTSGDVLPEPASIALLAGPVAGLVSLRRRRKTALAGQQTDVPA
jgi:hypothetical protein